MNRRHFVTGAASTVGLAMAAGARPRLDPIGRGGSEAAPIIIDGVSPAVLNDAYLDLLAGAGVTGWHKSMGGIESFADSYNFLDSRSSRVAVARTAADLRRAREGRRIALLFGWQTADPLGGVANQRDTPLRAYHELGLRVVNLVYNVLNQFGGGCLEPRAPLSRTGKRLVDEIHKLRIVLDVGGHTGEQTSLDAIAASPGVPIICSHTNMAGLIDNPRNISDRLAEAIAKTGGVIGLTAINDFNARRRSDAAVKTTPQAPLDALLDQYDYVKRLVGVDHVGMGNDFTTGSATRIDPTLPQFPPEMASDQMPINYVKGFGSIAELPNLTAGLGRRGWSELEIAKATGLNWLRVYEGVFGA